MNRNVLFPFALCLILGNEVAELINANKQAGSYEVTLNANGLASGIYFYKLHAGNFIET